MLKILQTYKKTNSDCEYKGVTVRYVRVIPIPVIKQEGYEAELNSIWITNALSDSLKDFHQFRLKQTSLWNWPDDNDFLILHCTFINELVFKHKITYNFI